MDKNKDLEYQRLAKKGVPESFDGKLLEVPVGTGILTMPMYKELPNAGITCLDYSEGIMNRAGNRAAEASIKNISFRLSYGNKLKARAKWYETQ